MWKMENERANVDLKEIVEKPLKEEKENVDKDVVKAQKKMKCW